MLSLTRIERLLLANQFRILEAVVPQEAERYRAAAEALERGYELHYKVAVSAISEETLPESECEEILDIMQMFSNLKHSYNKLEDKSGIEERALQFDGFDGNSEGKQLSYAQYFCRSFKELVERDIPDSHSHMLPIYRKMLKEYKKRSKAKQPLGTVELTREDIAHITEIRYAS
jgi:uncharacterized protein YfbU (UPF0304 family)